MWYFLERSYADGALTEVLSLWSDRIELIRTNPRGRRNRTGTPTRTGFGWRCAPEGGPVESYLTLKGNGREVELGAFLTPEERVDLHDMLGPGAGAPGLGHGASAFGAGLQMPPSDGGA